MTARRAVQWSEGAAGPVLAAEREAASDWPAYGLCREGDPDLFFPEPGGGNRRQAREAKKVCARCFVRDACRDFALGNPDQASHGIWGGLTEGERRSWIRRGGPADAKRCRKCKARKPLSAFRRGRATCKLCKSRQDEAVRAARQVAA